MIVDKQGKIFEDRRKTDKKVKNENRKEENKIRKTTKKDIKK